MALFKKPYFNLTLLAILGSLVRIFYGLKFEPWWQAPDQLAWELIIENGSLTYSNLIHYPHEGGSIIFSFLAKVFHRFSTFHSLTLVAIVIDFSSRLLQLVISKNVFGNRIAYLYGVWTLFAIPAFLPWGTVNYGLHALSGFFPFVLLWVLNKTQTSLKSHFIIGIFWGLCFWFYYSNIVLLLVYLLFYGFKKKLLKQAWYGLLGFSFIFVIHAWVRYYFDAGFHLQEIESTSIRGSIFKFDQLETYKNLYQFWFNSLPNTLIAGVNKSWTMSILTITWTVLLLLGSINGFIQLKRKLKVNYYPFLVIPIFIGMYCLSPFYDESSQFPSYVSVRHLLYILPFLILTTIIGLKQMRLMKLTLSLFFGIGVYYTSTLFFNQPINFKAERATGWVLGIKLGHSAKEVENLIVKSSLDKEELIKGVGWGISYAYFEDINIEDKAIYPTKIRQLYSTYNRFSKENSCLLMLGTNHAFSGHVRPFLSKKIYQKILQREEFFYSKHFLP